MKNNEIGMSLIVKTITRLTIGLILIYGIYISMFSSAHPGGGFAGGVIIALSFIHIMLAFGKGIALKKLTGKIIVSLMSISALLIICLAVPNFIGKDLREGIPVSDIAISLMVGMGLFLAFMALALMTPHRGQS
ncbi:MAG: hypothetical protein KJ880_03895 [Candidatus Omnitrophica bacterium]|nr:hypothetical protein [Candidatus Omnitrophota bacterium]MBU1869321.1 hypothetical protein [Candidatus Omnitrophota bacterium]